MCCSNLQVLDLQPGADAKSIKLPSDDWSDWYTQDKCSLPGAEEAFKSILKAAEHVSANDPGGCTPLIMQKCTQYTLLHKHNWGHHGSSVERGFLVNCRCAGV